MKKTGLLNAPLSAAIAEVGHGDCVLVCDAGFPIPRKGRRIDLAVYAGRLAFDDVLNAVLLELTVEAGVVAEATVRQNPKATEQIREALPSIPIEFVNAAEFKRRALEARVFVRSGECTPYSNILLVAGTTYDYVPE